VHILMISDVFFPRVNGVSTSIATFRRGLCENGQHRCTLVVPRYGAGDPPDPGGRAPRRCATRADGPGRSADDRPRTRPRARRYRCARGRRGACPDAVHRALGRCPLGSPTGVTRGRDLAHALRGVLPSLRAFPAAPPAQSCTAQCEPPAVQRGRSDHRPVAGDGAGAARARDREADHGPADWH